MRSILLPAGLWLAAACWGAPVPVPMNTTLLQRTDLAYRFTSVALDSADGRRHYQVWVGVPRHNAPAAGYPVLYMLDGNAAFEGLDPALLEALDQGQAPLLVAVGYAGGQRIDRDGRTFDYTPARPQGPQLDPLSKTPSGGAEAFLDLLQTRITPAVQQLAPIDPARRALWGHSYGGLFVLYVLMRHPEAFTTYAAASPSLWWAPGLMTEQSQGLAQRLAGPKQLWLMKGEAEPALPRPNLPAPTESAGQLARALAQIPGLEVRYKLFPGLGHGPVLATSLRQTLIWLNEINDN
ncbi:alpha/beta hydrolase [Pseudomonas typographi]|uniref:alpha/beta hydrolase n=1 Tax=Pseudomonas typographi TaxID=2715964 RepID=UPI0016898352|nr:alpha/beta fold hydrolase [Pseudomonas typographi]MBD1588940.1 alpha/beta hydrolase [Pseudomonas typographi]